MPADLRSLLQGIAPKLSPSAHKGQAGRITIIGGCKQYTGAPYFSGISTMKLGVDLTTIYCTQDAGIAIKSYSPDLMVDPILHTNNNNNTNDEWITSVNNVDSQLARNHCVVIGCGLGKDTTVQQQCTEFIHRIMKYNISLVIDGDGLAIVNNNPDIIKNYTNVVLTPNAMEFKRLWSAVLPNQPPPPMSIEIDCDIQKLIDNASNVEGDIVGTNSKLAYHTSLLASKLGNVTIVRKGQIDVISNGKQAIYCCATGGLKRVGGQGDITSGTIGTHLAWQHIKTQAHKQGKQIDQQTNKTLDTIDPVVLAAYGGCLVTRLSSHKAYHKHGRSMLTSNVVEAMQQAVHELYPVEHLSNL